MNGKIQGIIAGSVAIVCLAGVAVFLQKTGNGTSSSSSESSSSSVNATTSSDESVVILEKTKDELKSIAVTNAEGSYTMDIPDSGKSSWTIEEIADVNQSKDVKTSLANNCGELEAKKLVEDNVSDMSKYGLDKPAAKAVISYNDDTSVTLNIGNQSPDTSYRYVNIEGENKVYLVMETKIMYMLSPVTDFVDTALTEALGSDAEYDYGVETISRKDLDYDIVFEQDTSDTAGGASEQVMTSPIYSYLNITGSVDITHGLWGLSADSVTVIHPTEDDLKEYGLDDPTATVNMDGTYKYTLTVGNPVYVADADGNDTDTIGGYYCTFEGVDGTDCIYVLSTSSCPWASFKPEDVISTLMTTNYVVDVKDIKISYDDKDYSYALTTNGSSKDTTDADGNTVDIQKVTCNDKELDISKFKTFYQYVMTCPTNEIYFTDPESECYMTIDINCKDGKTDKMEIYKDTSRRYIVKLNGRTSFRIQSGWVETLLTNIENLSADKEVVENF